MQQKMINLIEINKKLEKQLIAIREMKANKENLVRDLQKLTGGKVILVNNKK